MIYIDIGIGLEMGLVVHKRKYVFVVVLAKLRYVNP